MPHSSPAAPLYPIKQLKGLEQNETNSYIDKQYLAVEFPKENANIAVQKKRKFVCLELSLDNEKAVKKYDHKGFKESVSPKGSKNTNKKLLVLYVKGNDQDKCFNEMQTIVDETFDLESDAVVQKIRDHFLKNWVNIKGFISHADMKRSYDEKTGEFINNTVTDLGDIYIEIKARYDKYRKKYSENSEEFTETLNEMQKILDEMKAIFDKNKVAFDHLITGTVNPVATSFKNLAARFDEKSKELKLINTNNNNKVKLNLLESDVITLKTDCKTAILSTATCKEEIFDERKEIKNKIDFLLTAIHDLKNHTITTFAIGGLEQKYNSLKNELFVLKDKINIQPIENLKSNSDERNIHQERMEKYFDKMLQPIFENIQNHSEKTSPEKASVLKKILDYLTDIKEKIKAKACVEDINGIIRDIKNLIEDKIKMLSTPRGATLFKRTTSADLAEKLKSELDDLVPKTIVNGQEQSFVSVRP
jgi:prophage DNA circulation protein